MKYVIAIVLSILIVGLLQGCDNQECPTEEMIVARIECKTTPDGGSVNCGNTYRCPDFEDFSPDDQADMMRAEAMHQLFLQQIDNSKS